MCPVSWKEYRDTVWLYRDEVRKAKAKLEPSFLRDAENQKGPCRHLSQKRKVKETTTHYKQG